MILAACGAGIADAFRPEDPLEQRQWYLDADRAFAAWAERPVLRPVRVAVIDSGIDIGHPEFAGRVAAARSFVGGSVSDTQGHGTFIAGEIAAAAGNGQGIAGIAFPAQLVVAKIVRRDGTIEPADEARAIRWALAQGARVINLSIGGLRDPFDGEIDAFSAEERDAVQAAVRAGALVVASVGNGDEAPRRPWRFASYPAALPHVLGVAAYARDGSVPVFSNRDPRFVDLAAPGMEIVSTIPRALSTSGCADRGYSDCGSTEFRNAQGTSFASPQAAAAAALLFAVRPTLRAEQVSAILERAAADAAAAGRDDATGWGWLNVEAAIESLTRPLPPLDRFEPNDAVGPRAVSLPGANVTAALDYWDDQEDVYRIRLGAGETIAATVAGLRGAALSLWQPERRLVRPGRRVMYRALDAGSYYLKVFLRSPGAGAYRLRVR